MLSTSQGPGPTRGLAASRTRQHTAATININPGTQVLITRQTREIMSLMTNWPLVGLMTG